MIGGLMKTTSRFAVAAAAGLFAGGIALTPAQAADLGGDCCADLEERVAELEATTVRKGNRKMSVKLSGQVNRAILFWDDGDESNTYVVDNDQSSSRFRITGDANWKPGWKVGFALEWEQNDDASNNVNANTDDNNSNLVNRQAHWWVKSDKFGKVSVGQLSTASDSTSEVNLSGATAASGSLRYLLTSGFALQNSSTATTPSGNRSAVTWGNIDNNFDGLSRRDGVRYDSPTFGGFTLSAGWYEDDMWDVALRFAKQWNSVLVAAAIAYAEDTEGNGATFCANSGNVNAANGGGSVADCSQISGSASILHQPTGLFATFAAAQGEDDNRNDLAAALSAGAIGTNSGVSVDDEANFWYANVGIYRRFNQHGKTSIGFDYMETECGFGSCGDLGATTAATGTGVVGGAVFAVPAGSFIGQTQAETWGVFLVQHIDNAATEFYLSYHHTEADIDFIDGAGGAIASDGVDEIDVFLAGARVKF